jgi:MFS family permease
MWVLLCREYRSLPAAYWTLWLGAFVNRLGNFVLPFLALYVTRERGESVSTAGVVLSLYGAGAIVAGLVGGVLADRLGRRTTMVMSLFGGAAAMMAIGLARSLPELCAATFLMGWLAEMYRPAMSAMVADLVAPADRARAYAHMYWVVNLGFALAPSLAALAIRWSYLLLFVIDAATMLLYGIIVLWRLPETRPAEPQASHGGRLLDGVGAVLRDRVFVRFLLLSLGSWAVMWQVGTSLPIDMSHHGISAAAYGGLLSINGILIVLLQPFAARVLAPYRRTAVLAGAALLFGIGFGMQAFVGSSLGYAIAIGVWTLGEIALLPTSAAVVADLAPPAMRGRYQGLYGMSGGAASFIGPLLGGAFLAGPGGAALWIACFALMVCVALGHVAFGRARTRREDESLFASTPAT